MSKKMGRKGRTTKHKQTIEETEATSAPLQLGDFQNMKRPQLQKLCKQLGLKATGKVRKHNIIVLRINGVLVIYSHSFALMNLFLQSWLKCFRH